MTDHVNGHRGNEATPPRRRSAAAWWLFVEGLGMLAQRRLRERLARSESAPADGGTDAPEPFLKRHRPIITQQTDAGIRRAALVLEIAARGESLWNRLATRWPAEPRHLLLPQVWGLRDRFTTATAPDRAAPAASDLAASLQRLRRGQHGDHDRPASRAGDAERVLADLAVRAVRGETETALACLLADALRDAAEIPLAQLLDVWSAHDRLAIVGLVDYFLCRALHADPRVSAEFVFIHSARPPELCEGELDVLARLVEEHASRLSELLDDQAPTAAPAVPSRIGRDDEDELAQYYEQAVDSYQAGEYPHAVTLLTAALRLDPANAVLYAYRGDAHRLLCEHDRALADYTTALRWNPSAAAVLVQRATVYLRMGEPARAVTDCTRALELQPQQPSAWLGRGDARLELAELDAAIADYSAAIGLQPESPWGYFGRAQAAARKQTYEPAIEDFHRVLALNPHHVPARLQLADVCREIGQTAQAILEYTEVLRLHPRNVTAYAGRGRAYELDGDIDRAIADYSQALRLDPDNARMYAWRGALLRRKGDLDRALADLDESIRHDPGQGDAHHYRGLILMTRGLPQDAVAAFDTAIRRAPLRIAGLLARALAHDALGRWTEGIQDCGRAIELDPQCAAAYLVRGVVGSHMGQLAQAVTDLTRTIDLDPQLPLAYHERGMVYLLQGEHEKALADYGRMLELNPASALAYAARGIVRQMQGEHAQAVADFARALELNPRSILAGWHQNTAEEIRRRTTQMLVDYIEGLWHEQQRVRLERRKSARVPAVSAPEPDGTPTAEHPVATTPAEPPKPRRRKTRAAPAAETMIADQLPQADDAAAATADETAAEILRDAPTDSETLTGEAPSTGTAATANANAALEALSQAAVPAPQPTPPPVFQCPNCRSVGEPLERLADRRVRCAQCKSVFMPMLTTNPPASPGSAPRTPAALTGRPKPKRPARAADADEGGGVRFTLMQKIILGTAAAAVILVGLYYLVPALEGIGGAAPLPTGKRISSDDLLGEFLRNWRQANIKYNEENLIVSGDIAEVYEDKQLVRFKAHNSSHSIEAAFRTNADMSGAKKEQKVSIAGECAGWQKNGGVRLINCKVFPYEVAPALGAKK